MKIGFVFESHWLSAKDGYYVKILELYHALKKKHELVVTDCPFEGATIGYRKRADFFAFTKNIDALLIVVSNFYTDKFTLSNLFKIKKIPIIWILEAPVEELLLLPWASKRSVFLNKLRLKFLAKHVDLCLCVSKEMQRYAINDLGIKKALVLPNATNPITFKKIEKPNTPLRKLKNCFVVMWAGAGQYPWQGLDMLYAVARKMKSHQDILFVTISTYSWKEAPTDLSNLLTLKSADYKQMPNYLNSADVLLCLYNANFRDSLYNSPMKLFDYMAVEKPIIASKLGQISEIITDGENGLLTDNAIDDICQKILLLKENPRLAKKIAKNARKDIVTKYNWNQVADTISAHFQQITKVQ